MKSGLLLGLMLLFAGCASDPGSVAVPEPTVEAIDEDAFVARGNEPGWRLDVGDTTLTLSWDYGSRQLTAATPDPVRSGGVTSYGVATDRHRLVVAIHDELCRDDMTGMPHPKRVILSLDARTLRGCGGEPLDLLLGPEWVIEDVDGAETVTGSRPTVVFDPEGGVGGRASCNHYGGRYVLTGEGLGFEGLYWTMMACSEPLMTQESRIMAILEGVIRFDFDDEGALLLHAADGSTLTARR